MQNETKYEHNKIYKIGFKVIKLLRKIKLSVLLFNFPNNDLYQNYKIYKVSKKAYEKEKFDCIICVFKPYFNIAAVTKLKKTILMYYV